MPWPVHHRIKGVHCTNIQISPPIGDEPKVRTLNAMLLKHASTVLRGAFSNINIIKHLTIFIILQNCVKYSARLRKSRDDLYVANAWTAVLHDIDIATISI